MSKHTNDKQSRQQQIMNAVRSLARLEASLNLDPAMFAYEKKRLQVFTTVPAKAIAVATNIVRQEPKRFVDFDVEAMQASVDFETEMAPLVAQVRAFADRVEKTVLKRRGPGAESALVLYATIKGLGRLRANEAFRQQAEELRGLFKRGPKKQAKKGAKAAPAPAAAPQRPSVIEPAPPVVTSTTTTTSNGPSAVQPS